MAAAAAAIGGGGAGAGGQVRIMTCLVVVLAVICAWREEGGAGVEGAGVEGAVIPCNVVRQMLEPCGQYLVNRNVATPGTACCTSVGKLDSSAAARENRQGMCLCIRDAIRAAVSLSLDHAKALPAMCGLKYIRFEPNAVCN